MGCIALVAPLKIKSPRLELVSGDGVILYYM